MYSYLDSIHEHLCQQIKHNSRSHKRPVSGILEVISVEPFIGTLYVQCIADEAMILLVFVSQGDALGVCMGY